MIEGYRIVSFIHLITRFTSRSYSRYQSLDLQAGSRSIYLPGFTSPHYIWELFSGIIVVGGRKTREFFWALPTTHH